MNIPLAIVTGALILCCVLTGCGKKGSDSSPVTGAEVKELAAQVEALRRENNQLRSSVAERAATASPPATTGEPTEDEMRQAIQDRIDSINSNLARMRETRPDRNDPMSAIIALSGAMIGDAKYEIGAFRKIGAEKAQGKAGFMCDYMLQLRASGQSAGSMDSIMRWGGSLCSARFVKNEGQWIWIAPGDEK